MKKTLLLVCAVLISNLALAAENKEKISAAALMPVYLRLSQAERELKLKKKDKEN